MRRILGWDSGILGRPKSERSSKRVNAFSGNCLAYLSENYLVNLSTKCHSEQPIYLHIYKHHDCIPKREGKRYSNPNNRANNNNASINHALGFKGFYTFYNLLSETYFSEKKSKENKDPSVFKKY